VTASSSFSKQVTEDIAENGSPPMLSTAVVALGGHAFMQPGEAGTHEEHRRNAHVICEQLMTLVERDYQLVITHGNGPQVGNLLLRDEQTRETLPVRPLDVLVAQTEGSLGYYLQQELLNGLRRRDIRRFVVTVVTQVVVDQSDPAFQHPTKPIGPFLSEEEARHRAQAQGWAVGEDAGRGWRRLVPSPVPKKVIQHAMIGEAAKRIDAEGLEWIDVGGGFGFNFQRAQTGPRRGSDLQTMIEVTLEQASIGTEVEISLNRLKQCSRCGGSGAEPGTELETLF